MLREATHTHAGAARPDHEARAEPGDLGIIRAPLEELREQRGVERGERALGAAERLANLRQIRANRAKRLLALLVATFQIPELHLLRLEIILQAATIKIGGFAEALQLRLRLLPRGANFAQLGVCRGASRFHLGAGGGELALSRLRGGVGGLHLELDTLHALIAVALGAHGR